ncbi:MAG: hypothetical protein IT377_15350 [Polyangiaceae bacterium]|nr:hypothetical protein [Polyangiaceae bacterium]
MSRLFVLVFLGSALLAGCHIESNDNGNEPFDDEDTACDDGHDPSSGKSADGGADHTADGAASDAAGSCKIHADCAAGQFCLIGSGQCTAAATCVKESDCLGGFNCDAPTKSCLPSATETCGEVGSEAACLTRKDCVPSYAGVDCTCGPDCKCLGGEPGCVCESFEFFRCETVMP